MPKSKANSFFFYMMEQKKLNPSWKSKSNAELMMLCDKGWRSLSPNEKRKYEAMKDKHIAKEDIDQGRVKGEVRIAGGYDSLGNPLADIRRRDLERQLAIRNRIDKVDSIVELAKSSNSLKEMYFYIMTTNIFAKVDDTGAVIPAEISVAKFSLEDGVVDVFQAFPKPGKIPLGYKRLCLENSDTGHKIPLELSTDDNDNNTDGSSEFIQSQDKIILDKISKFTSDSSYIFCMPEKRNECEGMVKTISLRSNLHYPAFELLPLNELLLRLANNSGKGKKLPSAGVAESELEKERFLYKSGISCQWHETMTETELCSSAIAWRLCFTILDLCCQHYGITLLPGKHVPLASETQPGAEWKCYGVEPRSKSSVSRVLRRPGEFASEDVRYKSIEKKEDVIVQTEKFNMEKIYAKVNYCGSESVGTIAGFMGALTESTANLSLDSQSSLEDYVTIDSMSQNSGTADSYSMVKSQKDKQEFGSVKRGSRIAAMFPGLEK